MLGWQGVEQAAPAGRSGRSWAKHGVRTCGRGLLSGVCMHMHMCRLTHTRAHTRTHTSHPDSCAGWTEKAAFQGTVGQQVPDYTGAVLGLYQGWWGSR